ncbi:nitric oxide reductase activation protein [Methylomonas montana]|uniref:nitric oxide reductase activation protein n=1 Tax=Methylomonas montana TaxID=3058963 RepID=UPI002659A3EA|nr:nitric oxide reductase activation protein [Methylomonas montana]WKJ92177.1 nitric oxide reductase activation protein [Methylomonas montana]
MKNRTLHNAFPIVAAAIGNRFGVKVSVGGDKAETDGQTIWLPAYEGDDADFQDYAWGLLAHEAAHIRYSDFTLRFGHSVLRRRLCGAIEDVRIEHELAKDFPGTRLTIRTVIEKMIVKRDFVASSIDDHPANILYSFVLKSLRAKVLGQSALQPLVEQTELALKAKFPKGAVTRLKGLLSEVPLGLQSESDCLQLTDRVLTMIEQEFEQQLLRNQTLSSADEDTPPEPDDTDQAAVSADLDDSNGSDSEEDMEHDQRLPADNDDEQSSESGGNDDSNPENPDDQPGAQAESSSSNPQGDDEEFTEIADPRGVLQTLLSAGDDDIEQDLFESLKTALSLAAENVSELLMPSGDEPPMDERAGAFLLRKVQGESGKIRAALQGLVQSQTLNRSQHASRGRRMDGKRLHRLPLGETKLFQRKQAKAAPNTAIHLLLDKSESMGYQVLMVMTDGQPNDTLSTLELLQRCRDSGIETVGIGLGLDVSHLFPIAITINDLSELRAQLFELSKSLLLAA